MRLGVHLPVAGKGASPETILQLAVEAERIGLDSVWSWDQWLVASAQAAANAAKEGGFMGFGAAQVSKGEGEMLDQVRAAVSQA